MTKGTKATKATPKRKDAVTQKDGEAFARMIKMGSLATGPDVVVRKHSHYYKNVRHLREVDVYRVLALFEVTDQAIGHAAKKLLVAGGRGAKDLDRDIQDVIDTLQRWQEMRREDALLAE